jgi:SecD/SecF fusion protein
MKNRAFWWFLVVFLVAWSIWETQPPRPRDLINEFERQAVAAAGDTTLLNMVARARELKAEQYPTRPFAALLNAAGTNDLRGYFPQFPVDHLKPEEQTVAILHRVQRRAAGQIKLGLDLQGGTSFLVEMDTNQLAQASVPERALEHAVEVLRKRVDRFGVAEPIIQPAGENRILIQLPGLSEEEKESAKTQIQRAAFLEFRLVHENSDELIRRGSGAIGYTNMVQIDRLPDGQSVTRNYLVERRPVRSTAGLELTGKHVSNAHVFIDPLSGEPKISLRFNTEGARIFGDVTSRNVGRMLAIVLDGELYSAPVIRQEIRGGNCEISGAFTLREAGELANVLVNPLEAPVQIIEERGVDPSLGRDSIRSGITAAIIGGVLVSLFMLAYYLLAGVVANVALLLNLVLLIGVMCSFDVTLTLPGIAGILLTIGLAVDANVLIYERIREELAAGKSLRGAVAAGYGRAFTTIFDSNVTTLIASVILIFFGTGPVRGFGMTLTIGVLVSMFTALVVTRLIFDFLIDRGWVKGLKMLSIISGTKLDFMRYARPAFVASWLLIVVGGGYGIYRGSGVFGVDFAGGDRLTLRYVEAEEVPVDQLRAVVSGLGLGEPTIQYMRDPATGTRSLQVTTLFDSGEQVEQALKENFSAAEFQRIQLERVGAVVGREIQKSAVISLLLAMFGILLFVAMRYEFSFAVGAVVAVIHDMLMTLGVFFLSGRELNAPIVAAILTIIGFSINDTIVIFDRIREDLRLGLRGSFRELMNHALNRTLSRTIITSGTTFIAALSLFVFGGGVIHDFAFTFLVGIITGTYSSIYIAGALVLWWHKGHRPKLASQVVLDNTVTAAAPARA